MNKIKPAIVAVGYNRPECMKRLLESVSSATYKDSDITLIVSIDECDKSNEVEKVARDIKWKYGEVIYRRFKSRQGLKNHILQCGDLSERYGAVIILEDDLIVSPCFYTYVLQCLEKYENDDNIAGIGLYSHAWNGYSNTYFLPQSNGYDVYFGQYSITWGQCWTYKQWLGFRNWYKNNLKLDNCTLIPAEIEKWDRHSWGKYFVYYIVKNNLYYVIPYISLSSNYSEVGEHVSELNTSHQVMILEANDLEYRMPSFSSGIKYDIFFERILEPSFKICGIPCKDICFDLNGQHRDNQGRSFLLTCRSDLKHERICSFGLILRPIEENIIKNVKGKGLYLYKLSNNVQVKPLKVFDNYRIKYELYDLNWRNYIKHFLHLLSKKLTKKQKQNRKFK